ncbi:hypothetical protein [Cytobacillus kochii]
MSAVKRILLTTICLYGLWVIGDISNSITKNNGAGFIDAILIKERGRIYFITKEKQHTVQMKQAEQSGMTYQPDYIPNGPTFMLDYHSFDSGDQVRIWYTSILESYPGRINIVDVEKID